jgi:hypothetical protein
VFPATGEASADADLDTINEMHLLVVGGGHDGKLFIWDIDSFSSQTIALKKARDASPKKSQQLNGRFDMNLNSEDSRSNEQAVGNYALFEQRLKSVQMLEDLSDDESSVGRNTIDGGRKSNAFDVYSHARSQSCYNLRGNITTPSRYGAEGMTDMSNDTLRLSIGNNFSIVLAVF